MSATLTKPRLRPIDCHIGEQLRTFRERQRLTLDALANRLGITATQLGAYEAGARMAPLTLYTIAEVLAVPLARFFAAEPAREQQADELARFDSPETTALLEAWRRLDVETRRRALLVVTAVAGE